MATEPNPVPATAIPAPIATSASVKPTVAAQPPAAKPKKQSFAGYPKIKYHPVKGAVTIEDPNEEAALSPPHDYFDTAGEADAHRTEREAQQVIHHNTSVKVAAKLDGKSVDLNDPMANGTGGVVRNSVQATESLNATGAEPL